MLLKQATTKIVANQSCLVMGVVNRSTLVNLSASLQGLIIDTVTVLSAKIVSYS